MIKKTRICVFLLLIVTISSADDSRKKRQTNYDDGYNGGYNGAAPYRSAPQKYQQQSGQYQQQSGQYQPQQQSGQYQPQQYQVPKAQKPKVAPGEEEKNDGPHPLAQLLEKSKFECGTKKDGYYSDSDVGCQAFHYCLGGLKHSMMCPVGTVFHQVHLNCVPAEQDICSKADKFYFVNDYLNKPLEQKGPNNTVQYHQRYYPENYANGDPFVPPQDSQSKPQAPSYQQSYAPQKQAYQPQQRPQIYEQQQQQQPQPQRLQVYEQQRPQQQQHYGHVPAKVPFSNQPAYLQKPSYAPQQQVYYDTPKPVYQKAQPAAPFQAPPRAVQYQTPPAQVNYQQPQAENFNYQSQSEALQAHRAAEAKVLAQHYKAQQEQERLQAQDQGQYQPPQQQQQQQQYGYDNYDNGLYDPNKYN